MRICYTCDTHGYIFPTNFYKKSSNIDMGLLKLARKFNKDKDTLVIDGGDTLQGSPLTHYMSKSSAKPIAEFMNLCGYDYVAAGNHDFNYGVDYLAEYVNELKATCLCANIQDHDNKLSFKPYVIHTMPNGLKIGILGLCTHHVKFWEKPETVKKLSISNPIDAIDKYLPILKRESDITICLYHGGIEIDTTTMKPLDNGSDENQGYLIATKYDFDLVLSAHQHIDFEGTLGNSYVVQNRENANSFVEININIDGNKKVISSERKFPDMPFSKDLAEPLNKIYNDVENWLDSPLGELSTELKAGEPLQNAINGSLIANFINQIQLKFSKADISACSLANEVMGFNKVVSVRDVLNTYKFSNTLCVLSISGKILKEYMEQTASYFHLENGEISVSESFVKPKLAHYNYDYFYNMDYEFDITKPVGERVAKLQYQNKDILPGDTLSIVVNSYRASGTGGYDMLKNLPHIKEIQEEVSGLIIKTLEDSKYFEVDTHIPFTVKSR